MIIDNPCSSLRDGVENLCSSVQYGVGFPSLGITERLIPAHLTMLDEKEYYTPFGPFSHNQEQFKNSMNRAL